MNHGPAIFALGFSHLWMAGWLAAAAAPLVIHLWNRWKHREVPWAATQFLLAALQKNARRIRVEQWLLLAIRTLVIVCVVLAVMGPYVESVGTRFVAGQPVHKVIVIDASYSMAYRPTDKSRFDRAKELATQIVEQSSQGDGFTLVLMAQPPRVVVGTPALAAGDFLEEIANARPMHTSADVPATLVQIEEVVARARDEYPRLARTEVYFLTDLGRNSWAALSAEERLSAGRDAVSRLAQAAQLVVIDLGQPGSENLAVTDLRPAEAVHAVGREIALEAEVRNFGSQPRRQMIELLVNGERIKSDFVEVAAGGQETLSFSHRFESPGDHLVELRLLGDALDVDNHRYLVLRVKPAIDVLLVSGDASARAARYLLYALDPDYGTPRRSVAQVERATESALLERDLSRYDAIFLSNVAQFTPGEASLLANYLRGGGAVVLFLGDRVQPQRYNHELGGQRPGSPPLLPARLLGPADDSQYSFDPLGYRHAIVRPFEGNEKAGLLTTPIARYFRMEPLSDAPAEASRQSARAAEPDKGLPPLRNVQTALAIRETGDPAIVSADAFGGRVVVVALPASLDSMDPITRNPWTLLPAWHSFVPLVQELLADAIRRQHEHRNVQVGQVLRGEGLNGRSDAALTLHTPDGRQETLRRRDSGGVSEWVFGETYFSGMYRVEDASQRSALFAVNVDTSESDLVRVDPDSLPAEFVTLTSWQNLDEQPAYGLVAHSGLHRYLLYTALLLLVLETFLAWLFGFLAS